MLMHSTHSPGYSPVRLLQEWVVTQAIRQAYAVSDVIKGEA